MKSKSEAKKRLLITGAGWIATGESSYDRCESPYTILRRPADSILIEGDRIVWVGRKRDYDGPWDITRLDVSGAGITPGLIDFHTHPVFAKTREDEFELRTQGYTYSEIAKVGGGILNSVKHVRSASLSQLIDHTMPYLNNALVHGTTTLEAKSGYGLESEAEYKMLRAIRALNEIHPIDLVPTFLGAHEYPEEYRKNHEGYLEILIKEMIPYVAAEKLAAACDVFCENGVYSLEEASRVLVAALENGLAVKVHAEQLSPYGGAKLAASMGALSADHLEFIDDEGINALASSSTVAGLLPLAAHFLRMKEDPPVRRMIDRGMICALATDFNPGSAMCENMQMALHLAAIRFNITCEEALWMATIGSAKALKLPDRGWIGPGALADLVAWKVENLKELVYHFGVNLADHVFKRGKLVAKNGQIIS